MDELLALLVPNEFITGERLCEALSLTRGAIWKRMEKLRAEGYDIESAGKRGYRLRSVENSLLPALIVRDLETRELGRGQIAYAQEMTSTNLVAKELANADAPHGSLAICERQTAGRGRLGRTWETPEGESLMQTLVLRPKLPAERAQLCTLAAAVAAAQAITDVSGLSAGIKWPNDVIVNGRKCVGILSELAADIDGVRYVVTGVGINVNQSAFPEELREKATSLFLESGTRHCRRRLLCAYLRRMEDAMDAVTTRGMDGLMAGYRPLSVTLGRAVRVLGIDTDFIGQAEALDETGALLVRDEAGTLRRVLSGDVSVRGLMGYV